MKVKSLKLNEFLPDSLRPNMFVQSGVNPDIHGAHLLFGKFLDLLDGTTSPVLETDSMQPFMEVDGVFAGDNFAHGRAFLLSVWWHFDGLER